MKMKLWSPVIAGAVITLSAASAFSQSPSRSIKVTCDTRNGIPTSIATTSEGRSQAVFHWQAESWFHDMRPEDLCEDASKNLQNYYDRGCRRSSFNVRDVVGLPAIFVEASPGDSCSGMLFTLAPTYSQSDSQNILNSILDPSLQTTDSAPRSRGDHPRINDVSLWDLLFG